MDATISRYTWARPPSVIDLSAILAAQSVTRTAPRELALEAAVAAISAAQASSQSATGSPLDQGILDLYM